MTEVGFFNQTFQYIPKVIASSFEDRRSNFLGKDNKKTCNLGFNFNCLPKLVNCVDNLKGVGLSKSQLKQPIMCYQYVLNTIAHYNFVCITLIFLQKGKKSNNTCENLFKINNFQRFKTVIHIN